MEDIQDEYEEEEQNDAEDEEVETAFETGNDEECAPEFGEEIEGPIEKVRKIVKFIKNSRARKLALDNHRKSLGKKPLQVILDSKTRWNTTYYMLERFIELYSSIQFVLTQFSDPPDDLNSGETAFIRNICTTLELCEDLSDLLCSRDMTLFKADKTCDMYLEMIEKEVVLITSVIVDKLKNFTFSK